MPTYKKKAPIENQFQAIQWKGDNFDEVREFCLPSVVRKFEECDYLVLEHIYDDGEMFPSTVELGSYFSRDNLNSLSWSYRRTFEGQYERVQDNEKDPEEA